MSDSDSKPPTQTLYPKGFTDSDAFGTPTLTVSTVSTAGTGGTANTTASAGSAGASTGSVNPRPPSRRRSPGTGFDRQPGRRPMKEYPLTREELISLGGVGVLATTCFSVGGGFVTRSLDITKDLELAQGVPPPIVARWQARADDSLTFGIIFIVIGVVSLLYGGWRVTDIIRSTEHQDAR